MDIPIFELKLLSLQKMSLQQQLKFKLPTKEVYYCIEFSKIAIIKNEMHSDIAEPLSNDTILQTDYKMYEQFTFVQNSKQFQQY